ncbi:MAG: hypothetical protein A3F83_14075 [Candidatus Glassbacteria bacterium RIFCSPLOWO2_12_FULL_58_11]|uniref:Diguanylate cyclase n=1 Tax=Candidatus Glassbacteria bacterium RIFCSPLOWO2_12_FULL_58_11 TaxID=1817867 RepID=A0A1F5Z444_9BACT|nr:MAG: hypothetical protein A3F83_14075 [Candidatus Glassbacteria bacterium RIFCSPLOWO2_12_FULL_58_11]
MSDKYIILVVDDDLALRKLYAEYLSTTGLHVDTAATGAEAAEQLQGHVYDLVLIDLKLPDMNGIELLKLTRKISPDTIPVILSGHATIELTIEAITLGAFDFLLKPVQLPKLSIVIQNGLERRRILLQNKKLISELQIAKQNLEAGIRQRTEQLKKSEQKFRTLYDSAPDVYYTVDTRGRIIDCNKMATEFFGCTRRELKAKHLLDLYTSDNFELVTSMVPTPDGKGGKVRHQEVAVKRSDGSVACVEINSNLLYDSDGKVIGALTIQRDVTARKNAEVALRESEERYRTIFQTAEVALLEVEYDQLKAALDKLREQGKRDWNKYLSSNPDFLTFAGSMLRVVDANRAAIKLFKAESKNSLLGELSKLFNRPDSVFQKDFIKAIAEEHGTFQAESAFSTLEAEKIHTLISLAIPRNEATFRNLLVSLVDITERRKTEEEKDQLLEKLHQLNRQLETLAVTDGLTKLYNHRFFMETINREFSRSHRMGLSLALLIADIDDFKNFNDTYGHQFGDEILVKISEILRTARRGSDIVARYGGEEFVLLLPDTGLEQAVIVAEKLRKKVENSVIDSKPDKLKVTISVGAYAMERSSLHNPKDLLMLADKALYRAKRAGKNRVCTVEEGTAVL